jgi:hypothetical protein
VSFLIKKDYKFVGYFRKQEEFVIDAVLITHDKLKSNNIKTQLNKIGITCDLIDNKYLIVKFINDGNAANQIQAIANELLVSKNILKT